MSQSQGCCTTPKKRGKQSITKEYTDQVKSPLEYPSLQIHNSKCFKKPLVPIPAESGPSKKFTPPGKRNVTNSSISFAEVQNSSSSAVFSGIVINTPKNLSVKSLGIVPDSSPLTPGDNLFSSLSRAHQLRSSPPTLSNDEFNSPLKKLCHMRNRDDICLERKDIPEAGTNNFRFSLSIDDEGKAYISDKDVTNYQKSGNDLDFVLCSKQQYHVLADDSVLPGQEEPASPIAKFDKRRVLGLLKQMSKKSCINNNFSVDTASSSSNSKVSNSVSISGKPTQTDLETSDFMSSSSPPSNTAAVPMTPRSTSVFQFKTGFTPCNIFIDELLTSPKTKVSNTDKLQVPTFMTPIAPAASSSSQHDHFIFKLSSGDPLLMNEEYSEMLAQVAQDPSELLQILTSPKRPLYFNIPSRISMNSPQSQSHMAKFEDHMSPSASQMIDQPSTPTAAVHEHGSIALQCTPLIQQSMSGTFPKQHIIPYIDHDSTTTQTRTINYDNRALTLENDDAQVALKELIKSE